MKIDIIIYSQSGHTASLAKEIAGQLRDSGLDCSMELLFPYGIPKPWTRKIQFRKMPDITEYDVVLLGAPVWAFNVSSVMRTYIGQITTPMKGKKVLPFVTHGLPLAFGPRRALATMRNELEFIQADILDSASLWYPFFGMKKEKLREAARNIIAKIKV